jgi:hypothetical protein
MMVLWVFGCTGSQGMGVLEGTWLAEEPFRLRGLVIGPIDTPEPSGMAHDYALYSWRPSQSPQLVQAGFVGRIPHATAPEAFDGELLFDVREDVAPWNVGARFASDLTLEGRDTLVLQGRTYQRVDTLPEPVVLDGFGHLLAHGRAPAGWGSIVPVDDGSVWAGASAITGWAVAGVGADGEPLTGGSIPARTPGGLVGHGDAFGYLTATGALVAVPRATAFDDPAAVDWQRPERCDALVQTANAWVAACTALGDDVRGLVPGAEEAVVWFDPATGAPVQAVARRPRAFAGLHALGDGDDVLIEVAGPSTTPAVHGDRMGFVLERLGPDGTRWATWSPDGLFVQTASALGDGVVATVRTDGVLPGVGSTEGPADRQVLFGPDGTVVWARDDLGIEGLLGHETGFVSARAAVEGGLAAVAFDACGDVVEERDVGCATGDLYGTWDMARSPTGGVAMTAWGPGLCIEGETYDSALVTVTGPEMAPACTPDAAVPDPVLEITIIGDGEVVVGETRCSADCIVPVAAFAAVDVEIVGVATQTPQGCTVADCVVYADAPVTSLPFTFVAQDATVHPWDDGVIASGETVLFATRAANGTVSTMLDGVPVVGIGPDAGSPDHGIQVRPATDEAFLLAADPLVVHRVDGLGATSSFSPATGIVVPTAFAVDGAGQVAVVGRRTLTGVNELYGVSAGTDDFTTPMPRVANALSMVGLEPDGFALDANTTVGTWTVGDTDFAVPEGRSLILFDGQGQPKAITATDIDPFADVRLASDGAGGVHVLIAGTSVAARHLGADGVLLDEVVLPSDVPAATVVPDGAGFAVVGVGVPAVDGLGGDDVVVTRTDALGARLAAQVGGTALDDGLSPFRPAASMATKGPTGAVWVLSDATSLLRFP